MDVQAPGRPVVAGRSTVAGDVQYYQLQYVLLLL
jgi:hypothetical protein